MHNLREFRLYRCFMFGARHRHAAHKNFLVRSERGNYVLFICETTPNEFVSRRPNIKTRQIYLHTHTIQVDVQNRNTASNR